MPRFHSGVLIGVWLQALPTWPEAALPEDRILVEGEPPLMQSDLDAWRRLLEIAFDGTLSRAQTLTLQESLVAEWQAGDRALRTQLTQAKTAWAQLDAAQGARREVIRLALRAELLEAAQREPDNPISKLVLTLYDSASPVLVEGQPPLRRGAVLALFNLLQWLASKVGFGEVRPMDLERERFVAHLVERYPHASPGDRMLLAHLEETFAWLQAEWEAAGPEGQANFRANLARSLGLSIMLPTVPYAGTTETWIHPDGLFSVDYPSEWAVRYASLPENTQVAEWSLLDVTVLGDADGAALELGALPEAGALIATAILPREVLGDQLALEEASVALAHDLLSRFGPVEPLSRPIVGPGAVLTIWGQQAAAIQYVAWLSVVLLPAPRGAAVVTVARVPTSRKADLEPGCMRVLYSLRVGDSSSPSVPKLFQLPATNDLLLDLLNLPLSEQMDLVEGLTSAGPIQQGLSVGNSGR